MSMTTPGRVLDFMYIFKVVLKMILALKHPRANVTLEILNIADEMHCV